MRETPGQQAAAVMLEDIDSTVDGRCACGCGAHLGPRSRSMWFANPGCQARWNARNAGIPSGIIIDPDNHVDLRIRTDRNWLALGNNQAVLIAWLAANGVDHTNTPIDNTIDVTGGELSIDVWRLHDGAPATCSGEPLRDRLVVPQSVALDMLLLTDETPPTTVMWVPEVADPADPTVTELNRGIDLTSYIVPGSLTVGQWDDSDSDVLTPLPRLTWWRRLVPAVTRSHPDGKPIPHPVEKPIPRRAGTYRLFLAGLPLAEVVVHPWWRRLLSRRHRSVRSADIRTTITVTRGDEDR